MGTLPARIPPIPCSISMDLASLNASTRPSCHLTAAGASVLPPLLPSAGVLGVASGLGLGLGCGLALPPLVAPPMDEMVDRSTWATSLQEDGGTIRQVRVCQHGVRAWMLTPSVTSACPAPSKLNDATNLPTAVQGASAACAATAASRVALRWYRLAEINRD